MYDASILSTENKSEKDELLAQRIHTECYGKIERVGKIVFNAGTIKKILEENKLFH